MLFCRYVPAREHCDPVELFKASTLQKLDGLTCKSHGKAPLVEFHGASLRDIRLSVRCCCRQFSTLANQAIARPAAANRQSGLVPRV